MMRAICYREGECLLAIERNTPESKCYKSKKKILFSRKEVKAKIKGEKRESAIEQNGCSNEGIRMI